MSRQLPPRDPVTGRFLPRGSEPEAIIPLDSPERGEEILREVDRRATGWRRWLGRAPR